ALVAQGVERGKIEAAGAEPGKRAQGDAETEGDGPAPQRVGPALRQDVIEGHGEQRPDHGHHAEQPKPEPQRSVFVEPMQPAPWAGRCCQIGAHLTVSMRVDDFSIETPACEGPTAWPPEASISTSRLA